MFEGLFQPIHLLLILAIIMIVFGAGKLPEMGGAVGRGIKEFRKEVHEATDTPPATPPASAPIARTITSAPATGTQFCTGCGDKLPDGAKFCPNCGTTVTSSNLPEAPQVEQAPAPSENSVV